MSTEQSEQRLSSPAEHPGAQPLEEKKNLLSDQYQALLDDKKNTVTPTENQTIKQVKEPTQAPEQDSSYGLTSHLKLKDNRVEMLDTQSGPPDGTLIGPTDPYQVIRVTVMVKSKSTEKDMDQTIEQITQGKKRPLTDAEFNDKFGADPAAMDRVVKFAKNSNLKVDSTDLRSGKVELEGTIEDMSTAFNVLLDDYKDGDTVHREQVGNLIMPRAMSSDIEGVFGLDNRPAAKAIFTSLPHDDNTPMPTGSHMPNEVADLYSFPKESMGAGQSVGIVQMGGGLDLKDNAQYYKDHNLKQPKIQVVSTDLAQSKTGSGADGEVALDSQIIGAVAPDANQQLIFAPNSHRGFVDAITRATFPEQGEPQNSAISISWGFPEPKWSNQELHSMNLAFKKAALKGLTVFAPAGDWGAHDLSTDGSYSTLYPSSDPLVTGVGGTTLDPSGKEVAWNDTQSFFPGGATGGGISDRFPVPDFQQGMKMPANANGTGRPGRGDPDIAADASLTSGYIVRFGGTEAIVGGTSCGAPLYAALMMRVNGALGHNVGDINPFLYKHGKLAQAGLEPQIFNNITDGDNNGYDTVPGWSPVTGWGSVKGDQFLKQLRQDKM